MIGADYMKRIGLTSEQITLLTDKMNRETRYRQLLIQEGISPKIADSVLKATKDVDTLDFSNEPLIREKIRAEWADFIIQKKGDERNERRR